MSVSADCAAASFERSDARSSFTAASSAASDSNLSAKPCASRALSAARRAFAAISTAASSPLPLSFAGISRAAFAEAERLALASSLIASRNSPKAIN